ncbi:hypothetical protein ACFFHK_00490 [Gallibacterium trehalosifermentans]|uniref:ACP-like domain-containing protein n=1 Tax=Gallibacterium trehalosifermentans TaxID=516935 RepID=A0ABV6GZF5_9PAST
MNLKTFLQLLLAVCLQIGTFQAIAATNNFAVQFPKGESSAELNGTIQGYDVDYYVFYAKKGQLATLEVVQRDPQVQFSLAYAKKTKQVDLNASQQVLPYSGKYILKVHQTRNDARKQPKAKRIYAVKLSISDLTAQKQQADKLTQVIYRCDNGKSLAITYQDEQAKVNWQGKIQVLRLNKELSQPNSPVFTNSAYLLSLTTLQDKAWQQSQIHSWLKLGKTATEDKVLLQECVVTK